MTVKSEYEYPKKIIIGTRGSPLALAQTHMVRDLVLGVSPDIDIEVKVIVTSGDWRPEDGEVRLDPLAGGKAQFAKELEEALLAGAIDMAVHSMKDMETVLPKGLIIPCMLPREDVRDAFLSDSSRNINDLPMGCVVGTVSVRRAAFLLHKRPDIKVVPLRGNVQTRIDKVRSGQVDATFLACAGLNRLGLAHEVASIIEVDDMLPAVGQGAIGIEMRLIDEQVISFIDQFKCLETYRCVECERGVLRSLGGSCHTSVGVLATLDDTQMRLRVQVVAPDGSDMWAVDESREIVSDRAAIDFGEQVGSNLKTRVPNEVLARK
ncbi:MAG: hydroxymethylbilane synthase [Alphaproteobacteria bacterium]